MGKAKKLAAPRPDPNEFDAGVVPAVRAEPLVVIVVPARELAIQIFNEARKFCYRTMLRPCVIYGGGPLRDQIDQLSKGCDVLIASPGRLIDMMERPHILTLRRVKYMVIDEADEMLHADWEEEFNKILSGGGKCTELALLYQVEGTDYRRRAGRGKRQVHALLSYLPCSHQEAGQDSHGRVSRSHSCWPYRQLSREHQAGHHLGGPYTQEASPP